MFSNVFPFWTCYLHSKFPNAINSFLIFGGPDNQTCCFRYCVDFFVYKNTVYIFLPRVATTWKNLSTPVWNWTCLENPGILQKWLKILENRPVLFLLPAGGWEVYKQVCQSVS